jgi:hypothetical protein
LQSIYTVELAARAVSLCSSISFNKIVNVAADAALLHTAMLVTTVVVLAGTVYKVVLDVAAAVRARTFEVVVAISYYTFRLE